MAEEVLKHQLRLPSLPTEVPAHASDFNKQVQSAQCIYHVVQPVCFAYGRLSKGCATVLLQIYLPSVASLDFSHSLNTMQS